ncbi:hypothetical protein DAI22_11g150100 [Oryza sativa Japonica Group]|nr:hypothetical protein DAI22_11g150100 [Oryza sativa Japonica Group]
MIFFLRVDYQDSDTRKGNRRTRGCERGSKTLGSSADLSKYYDDKPCHDYNGYRLQNSIMIYHYG